MFEKRTSLQYWNVSPKRITGSRFVRSPEAFLKEEGRTSFLCPLGEASILIDYHEEIVGGLELKVTCLKPAHITVIYEETPEGAMRREPYICTWYEQLKDEYELKAGEHTLISGGRRGFRYVGIFVESEEPVELISADAINGSWPVQRKGSFRCSDERLNRIWDISIATAHACMQEFYEDGVKRDGLMWIGDYRWTFLSGYYTFGDSALARKCLLMIRDSQYENGAIPPCAISSGGHIHDSDSGIAYMGTVLDMLENWVIPNYICEYICAIEEYIRYTGDQTILPEVLGSAEKALDFLVHISDIETPGVFGYHGHAAVPDEDGLTYCQEYDCTMNPKTQIGSDGGFLMDIYGAAKVLGRLAKIVGDNRLCTKAKNVEMRFDAHIEKYYKEDRFGQYVNTMGQEASDILQYVTIQAHLAGKKDPMGMKRMLRSVLPNWGYSLTCRLEVMFAEGYIKEALEAIRSAWGKMLDADSLTCWERLDAPECDATHYYDAAISYCHGWTSSPAGFLPKWITGVHTESDGFKTIRIEPHLDTLDWAEATVATPYGELMVRVERDGLEQHLYLDIPEGIQKCTVKLENGTEILLEEAGYHSLLCK